MILSLGRKYLIDLPGDYSLQSKLSGLMNTALARLSRSIISTLKLDQEYTGRVRLQIEFRSGQIVQMRKLMGEQVLDLSKMHDQQQEVKIIRQEIRASR